MTSDVRITTMTSDVNLLQVNTFLKKCEVLVQNFEGGQISKFVLNWKKITSDRNIINIVMGDSIKFIDTPPCQHFASNPLNPEEARYVKSEITKLKSKRIIKRTHHENIEYVSPIFVTPKSDGDYRVILNLKQLNQFIEYQHFKMHTIKEVLQMVYKDCYMTSIDLKDAYYSVKIAENYHCFLKFQFENEFWQYVCYPNGLAPCPRKFTKLTTVPMCEIRKKGHPICGYIDDFILIKSKFESCLSATLWAAELFVNLGFVVHPKKSQLIPQKIITFLGFVIDSESMTISVTEKRRKILIELLITLSNLRKPTIRFVAKVLGHLISVLPASRYGALHYRKLENDKIVALSENYGNFDATMVVSVEGCNDINWWLDNSAEIKNWVHPPAITKQITTDASDFAWGVVFEKQKIGGSWSLEEEGEHINVKEMLAIYFAVKAFVNEIKGHHVKFFCDNTTAVGVINKQGSSKSEICDQICQLIWEWCRINEIWITCTYIPGSINTEADTESRRDYRDSNWMLNRKIFQNVCKRLNYEPTIDCFANRLNSQLPKYISYKPDPNAYLINAFSHNWAPIKGYLFPPFSLVGRVLQKLRIDQATALLIAPDWPSQPWYTTLMDMVTLGPIRISPAQSNLVLPTDPEELHPLWRKLTLLACLVSGKI